MKFRAPLKTPSTKVQTDLSSCLQVQCPPTPNGLQGEAAGGSGGGEWGETLQSSQYNIRGFSPVMMTDVSPGPPQEGHTDTILLEILQRKGVGAQNLIVTFISDLWDQSLESE